MAIHQNKSLINVFPQKTNLSVVIFNHSNKTMLKNVIQNIIKLLKKLF